MTDAETLQRIRELVFEAYPKSTDGTSNPFWAIAQNSNFGNCVMISDGFWLSREKAQQHLERCRHRYSKKAFVYCFSSHLPSSFLSELLGLLDPDGLRYREGFNAGK